jgi:alginate O-acetyltransferase complex protein AlgJ
VDHLTGPAFLSARAQRQGDPVAVLARFAQQLAVRGVTLIVAPLPVKAAIHPEKLIAGFQGEVPVRNPSDGEFLEALRARGVAVCDIAKVLADARDGEASLYLARDSHWTPEGMKIAAAALANSVRPYLSAPPASPHAWRALDPVPISHAGDLAVMLAPESASDFGWQESIEHQVVVDGADTPWAPDPAARVLLLGDSFVNIYDQEAMGWGSHGGLAAWITMALQEPVDTLTQNGDGAHATRQRLRQALQRNPQRLAGKEVLIFAFAARELSVGDWKPELELPEP